MIWKYITQTSPKVIYKVVLEASTTGDLSLTLIFLRKILRDSCQDLAVVHIFQYAVDNREVD